MPVEIDPKGFKLVGVLINNIHTDIACYKFVNKICLFITQYEKLNNIFVACKENIYNGTVNTQSLNIKHSFGTDTDEIESAVRYLINKIPALNTSINDVIISCGLKEINRNVLKSLECALCKIII